VTQAELDGIPKILLSEGSGTIARKSGEVVIAYAVLRCGGVIVRDGKELPYDVMSCVIKTGDTYSIEPLDNFQ
jgi:hypothetical protein